jgi:hypothetical protein
VRRIVLALAVLIMSSAASAQEEDAQEWLRAYISNIEELNCSEQVAQADLLNAFELLRAANACGRSEQWPESSFLMLAGQNRAVADMSQLQPADRASAQRIIAMYGFIYCCAGGIGKDEVLRNDEMRERFLALYDGWAPNTGLEYDPGWSVIERPDPQEFATFLDALKQDRRVTIEEFARKYADDAYFALHREQQDLHERTGGSFVTGTPEAAELDRLSDALRARAEELGFPEPVRPDPEALAADNLDAHHPPAAPEPTERFLTDHEDAVTRKCAQSARFGALASGSTIASVLVTTSEEWGTIWRADIVDPRSKTYRDYCTSNFSGSRPLEMEDRLQPLSDLGGLPPSDGRNGGTLRRRVPEGASSLRAMPSLSPARAPFGPSK